MQLKLQRSQRAGGITGGTVLFCLDVRADYSPEERDNIRRYRLGSQVIYNSQAARKHLESAGAQIDRTQVGTAGNRAAGLARGALSLAMAKMSLNISIDSLGRGHHIECKDLEELLEAEETVREACKNVTRFLDVAATFDGSEVVIEYEKGEEKVHVSEPGPPMMARSVPEPSRAESVETADPGSPAAAEPARPAGFAQTYHDPGYELGQRAREFWSNPQYRKLTLYAAGVLAVLLLIRSCT